MVATVEPLKSARSAIQRGDLAGASRVLSTLLRSGGDVGEFVEAAQVAITYDAELAERLTAQALEQVPGHPGATHTRAEALARTGSPGPAYDLFRQAVQDDGSLAELTLLESGEPAQPWIGRFEDVDCPLCGERAGKPVWAGNISQRHRCHGLIDPVRLWTRCAECGLVRVSAPPPRSILTAWRALRPPAPQTPPDASRLSERLLLHDRVIERIRAKGYGARWVRRGRQPQLLDLGDEWGEFLAAASWRGFDATGLLDDKEHARWARRALEVDAHAGEIPADLPAGTFDVITLWERLDRADDPVALLEDLMGRLELGGVLALTVSSLDHPHHQLLDYDDPLWSDPERRTWFDRESLALLLLRVGLQPLGAWHDERSPGSMLVLSRRPEVDSDGGLTH